jgi:ABC-type oligopeptide transport system substrate-binding subunit
VIVENITRMGEQPADTYIPRGVFKEYTSPDGAPFDVAGAKKLLADAGYPNGANFPALSVLFNTGANHSPVAENVVNQWRTNLGINVTLEGVEIKVFRQRLHGKDYAIARASWFGDYNDRRRSPTSTSASARTTTRLVQQGLRRDVRRSGQRDRPDQRLKDFERAERSCSTTRRSCPSTTTSTRTSTGTT